MSLSASRRYFVPEVIQSSAMDCGPASLKSMLDGFGIHVGYGRLREACSTDVDGTSIDTLQDMAAELGLEVEQTMVPLDHLLLPEAGVTPAIVVVKLQNSGMHFVVLWRLHGSFVQVMDPGVGRRWMTESALLRDIYEHQMAVDAAAWREFAATEAFEKPLVRRMNDLGMSTAFARDRFAHAAQDPSWRSLARLDAAVRMLARVARSGGGGPRRETELLLERLCGAATDDAIPERFWTVRSGPASDDGEVVTIRGAVLVRAAGRTTGQRVETEMGQNVDPALLAALREPEETSWKPLYAALRESGVGLGSLLVGALGVAAATVLIQALLLRGALDIGYWLGISQHRLGAAFALAVFSIAAMLLELPITLLLAQLGRKLEVLIRVAFQRKIPRTADHYFHSRLLSDLASRLHSLPIVRSLPTLAATWLRTAFLLAFTVAGILWLAPWLVHWVIATTVIALLLSLFSIAVVQEREMRVQSHNATLSRFYLDALQGVSAISAHAAGRALMREQEGILVQWADASRRLQRASVAVEALQAAMGVALAIGLVTTHVSRHGTTGSLLLVTYWALQLPALTQSLAVTARQVPAIRNTLVRVLEPLGAPEETEEPGERSEPVAAVPSARQGAAPNVPPAQAAALVSTKPRREGVRVELADVDVRAGGHVVLGGINLTIAPGDQVGIVGASGAGKSTLIGLLLGWSRAASGRVMLDGELLAPRELAKWRRRTAWVDPAVQLFNRPLVQNILYGNTGGAAEMARAIDAADLRSVLERLPEGLQTILGESGALVSGGEGQRVRLARAWLRDDVRLVLLDEPFRGLDRDKRRVLLDKARAFWAGATMICVTHDIADTLAFGRVLVIEDGKIVEDGDPRALACDLGSRYHAMLADEQLVRENMWANPDWRRIRIEAGQVVEQGHGEWTDLPELIAGASERES